MNPHMLPAQKEHRVELTLELAAQVQTLNRDAEQG